MRSSAYSILFGLVLLFVLRVAPLAQFQPGYDGPPGEAFDPSGSPDSGSVTTGEPAEPLYSVPECPPLLTFVGEGAEDQFGLQARNAGDVNGDSINDIIIGAPYNDEAGEDAGKVYVYSGLNGALIYSFAGEEEGDWFGMAAASAGDLDGDGFSDLVIGSRLNDANGFNSGRVYVFSGQTGDTMYVFTGELSEELGSSVASAGDVNDDGFDDLIVGAWANSANGTYAGRAYLFSGPTGDTLSVFTGGSGQDWFGNAVASAGDANGDGVPDLLIGAMNESGIYCDPPQENDPPPCHTWHGTAYLYSGLTYERLWGYAQVRHLKYCYLPEPLPLSDRFGVSVASAGDIDNDGLDEVLIGADGYDRCYPGPPKVGAACLGSYVYAHGQAAFDHMGLGVSSAGDVNNDGYDDVLVGAWGNDAGSANAGRAYIFSGRTQDTLYVFTGGNESDWMGASVASLGDINDDGFDDFMIGSPGSDAAGNATGRVDVYLGGWVCGDADGDRALTMADVEILRVAYFESSDYLSCVWRTSDLNCNAIIDLADVVRLADYVFGAGPPPCCEQ